MQIDELLNLCIWFKNNIEKNNISQKYLNLYNKMNVNVRRMNGQQAQPFLDEKNILFESLSEISLEDLTIEQIKFLEQLEVDDLISKPTIKLIDNDLIENNLDIATATNIIKNYSDKIANAQSILQTIYNTLNPYFEIHENDELDENEVLMRIYFQSGVSINNLIDLKKLSNNWFEISRGIAIALDEAPESFKVIGAKKGSIILDLAVIVGVATTVSKILLEALKVADRVLDIKKKAIEIKSLKLQNKKIEQELNAEAQSEKENGIKIIVDETITQLGLNSQNEGDKIIALEKSVKKLLEFTENGGQVDFVFNENISKNPELREENKLLRQNVEKIRELESKIKYLE